MNYETLEAQRRTETGKGAMRKLRASGLVPAVFYSAKSDAIPLSVSAKALEKLLKDASSEFVQLVIKEDGPSVEKMTLIKEIQRDVIRRFPIHIDFWEVDMGKEVVVEIPIKLIGTPAGVADGGVLEQIRREITVSGRPKDLIDVVEVDVSSMGIGDVIHVNDLSLGDKIRVMGETNFTLATVAAPTVVAEEKEEVVEGEEAEVEEGGEEEESESS